MARALAARTVMLCTLILGVSSGPTGHAGAAPAPAAKATSPASPARPAAGARRPVAVIALADDPAAEALANRIGTALVNHAALAPLEPGSMIGALVGEFLDESRDQIASAQAARERAERALAEFGFPVAISTAQVGHESLHTIVPSTYAVALYADLALTVAKAKLGENRPVEAGWYFGLVHQLTPGRHLDPALHLPEVVAAFEVARRGAGRAGTLAVKGTGQIWIDGRDQGGKARIALPAGLHVVWLTGLDRETVGRQVYVQPDAETTLDLGEAPAPLRLRVQRARIALRNAPDQTRLAVEVQRLAGLLAVRDAVLITMPAGKLIVQTWHAPGSPGGSGASDALPGLSGSRLAAAERSEELLRPLAAPPRAREGRPTPLPSGPPRWYQRRPIQATIVAGVLGVIVGSVMLAQKLEDKHIGVDGDTVFLPPPGVR